MTPTQTLTLKLQTGGLRLDLAEHFMAFIKIELASTVIMGISGQQTPRYKSLLCCALQNNVVNSC